MNSEITVITASYNPGKFLIKALQSVYEQTYLNWKLILVDDCSTDNSLKMARDLLKDPRITVIKNSVNLGQSGAQNVALKSVTTPYFIQLDSDDWLMPDTLETLLNEFKKQPEDIAVVSGNILVVERNAGFVNHNSSRIAKGRLFKDKYDFMLFNKSVWPRCYRTSAVRKVGGWPTDVPYNGRYMEDKLILYRLIEKYRFYWIDKVLYVHRSNDESYNGEKIKRYNYMIEWAIRNSLKLWGDNYEPIFDMWEEWKCLKDLVPKN